MVFFQTLTLSITFLMLCICYSKSEITAAACSTLDGTFIGGQCFFSPRVAVNWTAAWDICAGYNATLAQVHTSMENEAVFEMIKDTTAGTASFWLGLQTIPTGVTTTNCSIPNGTTYWYDSVTSPNMQLVVENTWMRYHSCEGSDLGNDQENFIEITYNGVVTKFLDVGVNGRAAYDDFPLCQISSTRRTYLNNAKCITETPIEVFNSASFQQCADLCSCKLWCRSFNFVLEQPCNSGRCELFSFSGLETCPECPSMDLVENCVHYDVNQS